MGVVGGGGVVVVVVMVVPPLGCGLSVVLCSASLPAVTTGSDVEELGVSQVVVLLLTG